jgi:mRNA-degrading endonuclease RelE of RelBE toxin-antitoxin system
MHKIDKFLARLDVKLRQKVLNIAGRIKSGNFAGLDMRKLKGPSNIYRVRVGRMRIVFTMDASGVRVLTIDNRAEDTYRGM